MSICQDIFMLLNHNNDGYLNYNEMVEMRKLILEMPDDKDKGKIVDKEKFDEMFKSLQKYNVDILTFKKFMDAMEVNT